MIGWRQLLKGSNEMVHADASSLRLTGGVSSLCMKLQRRNALIISDPESIPAAR
jgi:hypothetical protein